MCHYKNVHINQIYGQLWQLFADAISNGIVMCQLIRFGCISRGLNKSDRINIKTRSVFFCAVVSSDIFGTVSIVNKNRYIGGNNRHVSIVPKNDTTVQYNTQCVSMPIRFDLSRRKFVKHRRNETNCAYLCIMIRFVRLSTIVFYCELICRHNCQACP